MNVLLVCEFYPLGDDINVRGGVEARAYKIVQAIATHHKVYVITSREQGQPAIQVKNKITIWRVGHEREYVNAGQVFKRLSFMWSAYWKGMELQFHVVEGSSFFGWFPALLLSLSKKTKRVLFVADVVSSLTSNLPIYISPLLRFGEKVVLGVGWDRIICISKTVQKKLTALSVNAKNISVVYCGADQKLISKLHVKKLSIPRISCVSRLVSYKHIEELIEAVNLLSKQKIKFGIDIIGSGPEEDRLRTMVVNYKLTKYVRFRGHVAQHKNVLRLVKRSHIFCLPSVVEGFGIATIEALSAGVPVVIPHTAINHEITQGKGAIFFESGNAADLALKLAKMLGNLRFARTLGTTGKKMAVKYDWALLAGKTVKIYENLYSN